MKNLPTNYLCKFSLYNFEEYHLLLRSINPELNQLIYFHYLAYRYFCLATNNFTKIKMIKIYLNSDLNLVRIAKRIALLYYS